MGRYDIGFGRGPRVGLRTTVFGYARAAPPASGAIRGHDRRRPRDVPEATSLLLGLRCRFGSYHSQSRGSDEVGVRRWARAREVLSERPADGLQRLAEPVQRL